MKYFFTFLVCAVVGHAAAQQFAAMPPAIRWQILQTDTVDVIFPKGFAAQASRIATIAAFEQQQTAFSIGQKIKKTPIVLQPFTLNSNGYVQLAPSRSEFYLTPPQSSFQLGSNRWIDNLALHEYRHIMQYNNLNVGLSRTARILLGQHGQELLNNAAIPNWFWEGDAVYYETALSNSGRGRSPNFFNYYKSLWAARKHYSFMKLRNGSLKDMIPSHYHLGYLLVSYGRIKYGEDFWAQVCKDAAAYKGSFYPFQKALRKYGNISYRDFHEGAFDYFKQALGSGISEPTSTLVAGRADVYFPQVVSDTSFIYLKSSPKHAPGFYLNNKGNEKLLFKADFITDNYFYLSQNKIVYSTPTTNARWNYLQYSDIRWADVTTKTFRTITKKGRYFSPAFSADGSKIVCVMQSMQQQNYLQILNAETGKILIEYTMPEDEFASFPKFLDDGKIVFSIRDSEGKMGVAMLHLADNKHRMLIPFSTAVIESISVQNGNIYFAASARGNDDIFELNTDGNIYRITSTVTGGYQPSVKNDQLLYTTLTWEGYKPIVMHLSKSKIHVPITEFENGVQYVPMVDRLYTPWQGDSSRLASHELSSYRRTQGWFNFHSIKPYYESPNWSLTLMGENVLNNVQTEAFYAFNENEQSHETGFRQAVGVFYPVITYGSSLTVGRVSSIGNYNQININAGAFVPLNLSKNKTISTLRFGSNFNYEKAFQTTKSTNAALGSFYYLNHFIRWRASARMAPQHIVPRKAIDANIQFKHAVNGSEAWQLLAQLAVNLPSVFPTHGFVLTGSYQRRDTAVRYLYANQFPFSRGYTVKPDYPVMYKVSGNYLLPLAYPDFGVAHIVYFSRIRATLFYDNTIVQSLRLQTSRIYASIGAEVWFDTRWWNQFPLSFGLRFSRVLNEGFVNEPAGRFEFLLPVLF